ncbi:MAG: biopolymer transporter ExbD [Phycisphaeraceae bacterium]|nr:MAG: biopolymer transporter ExbD [Phycisphaeraceae bacterium]
MSEAERALRRTSAGRTRRGRRRSGLRFGVTLTPMIDVVFLLMIYFLLVGEFRQDEEVFALDLPREAEVGREITDPFALPERPIRVRVRSLGDGPGDYTIATDSHVIERAANFEALRLALENAYGGALPEDQRFIVRPDADARWEHTLGALDAIRRAGYTRIRFDEPGS